MKKIIHKICALVLILVPVIILYIIWFLFDYDTMRLSIKLSFITILLDILALMIYFYTED